MSCTGWLRGLALVLSSAFFFPVSCTTATLIGTVTLSKFDERKISRGDEPHGFFHVVVHPSAGSTAIAALRLDAVRKLDVAGDHSFLMVQNEGEVTQDKWVKIKFSVVSVANDRQVIETIYLGDDQEITARYEATAKAIVPLSSKLMAPGFMFGSLSYAFVTALGLWAFGKILLSRLRQTSLPDS